MPGYLSMFPLQNTKCRDNVCFTGQTGSPKEVLEVPLIHQLNGVDHPVCRVPTMTEGRPLAISPPPGPGLPDPPSSSGAGELVLSKNIYSLGHICDCCGLCGDEGMESNRGNMASAQRSHCSVPQPLVSCQRSTSPPPSSGRDPQALGKV